MKRFFSYLMVMATLVLGGGKAMASEWFIIDSLSYIVEDGYARMVAADPNIVTAVVPSLVVIDDVEYSVKKIGINQYGTTNGHNGFYNCRFLTSVILPKSVNTIDYMAFENCTSLTTVIMPDSLDLIQYDAFENCTSLTSIVIPEGVTRIEMRTFQGCSSLETITFPSTLCNINMDAFSGCTSLRTIISNLEMKITISDRSGIPSNLLIYAQEGTYAWHQNVFPNSIVIDGEFNEVSVDITVPGTLGEEVLNKVAYIRDVNSLIVSGILNDNDIEYINSGMPNLLHLDLANVDMEEVSGIGHQRLHSIILPKNCKIISNFGSRENLTEIIIPNTVEVISGSCFSGCNRLDSVVMSVNLKTLGDYAFYGCKELACISFGDSIRTIGNNAFENCSSLSNVVLSEETINIGRNAFMNCSSLEYFCIPSHVEFIGSCAFQGCKSLKSIIIPSGIKVINNDTFNGCNTLTSVTLPDGLTTIATSAFADCYSLSSIDIPSTVTSIGAHAFTSCSSLQSISLPEGISEIGITTFAHCSSLKEIILPSTLKFCDYSAFLDTGNLEKVICLAFFPPITGGDLIGANNCTLYVPEWTISRYKLTSNWNLFSSIEPISGIYPNAISVYTDESLTITSDLAEGYKPFIELTTYNGSIGKLAVRGENTLSLSTFKMTRDNSLINHGIITADSIVTDLTISTGTWHFLSFPYDVKVSDIVTEGNWVVSRYDGVARANEDFGNTWKTLPYDTILHAGEGYIWHTAGGHFAVPAMDNENKNLIFANDTRYIQLKENPAATEANYGWNLIGNPYPCYYDTRYMQFSSPITVRSGDSYAAYSPVDDSYILSPLEAFFVQCSAENNIVSFDTEGRQTDNTVRTLSYAPARTRTIDNERSVLNIYLESNAYADHTRLVVNEGASLAYEIACDAAKFMSDDATVPQLFTIEGGERMAINERPLANGKAALGIYIGKAGSYTLSLDTKAMDTEVFLIDKLLGTETDLASGSYVFTTEAGTFIDRFEIRMKRTGVVDGIEAVAAELKVEATADGISVSNATTPIYIYSATGALVDTKVGSAVAFDVPQGVYVVKVGDSVHKVVVK